MSEINLEALGITADAVTDRIADKALEMFDIYDDVKSRVAESVKKEVERGLSTRVEAALSAEMERILDHEILPTNMWGESNGEPTTIRDQLALRARTFWEEKVNKDGKRETYGGKPRFQWIMDRGMQEQFDNALRENMEAVIAAFKVAVAEDSKKWVTENLNKLLVAAGTEKRRH